MPVHLAMQRSYIAIIGKFNKDLAEQIVRDGFHAVFFKDTHHSRVTPRGIPTYPIDFSSKKSILASLRNTQGFHIIGVIAIYESYIPAQHWIAAYYKLPHATERSIERATDKRLMRECFQRKAPHITPAFQLVRGERTLETFAKKYGFPLMLKPTNLMKSLLVTTNYSFLQLKKNYQETLQNIDVIYTREGVQKIPNIIIEECLIGSFHSIDAFIDSQGVITTLDPVDLIMGIELGLDDNFNYLRTIPSQLQPSEISKVRHLAIDAIRAIGLTNSPAHIELVYTENGPKIIEIGARVGGYRPRMYAAAFGLNILQAQINISIGKPPILKTGLVQNHTAVFEIFPKRNGALHSIHSLQKLKLKKSATYISVKRHFKEAVGPAKNGFRAVAVIFLVHKNKLILLDDINFVKKNIRVRLMNA